MDMVAEEFKKTHYTIQLGGANDFPAGAELNLCGKLTYEESAYVMSKASVAVTVDSFMAHLAGSLGINQICLFGSGNENVVKPNQISGKLVCLSPDYINHCPALGPCSGGYKCFVPCTGRHDPKKIIALIKEELL